MAERVVYAELKEAMDMSGALWEWRLRWDDPELGSVITEPIIATRNPDPPSSIRAFVDRVGIEAEIQMAKAGTGLWVLADTTIPRGPHAT